MKKLFTLFTVLPVLLAFMLAGCSVEDPASSTDLVAPAGEQLFSNYVAIGNSLTAGFMDGGLSISGQTGSYPLLIANQIGAPAFDQPYISLPGVGTQSNPDPENDVSGILYWNGSGVSMLGVTPISEVMDPTSGFLMAAALPTPYHNLGVPGATLHDVMNAIDPASSTPPGNSFFLFVNRASFFGNVHVPAEGMTPAYETASMFGGCIAKGPKLLTAWIGNNEILGPAMAGTSDGIVDPGDFGAEYTAMIANLAGGLVQRNGFPSTIVLGNIPSISSAAFFVPRAFLEADPPNGAGIVWPGYEETDAVYVTLPGLSWIQAMTDAENWTALLPGNYTLSVAEVGDIEAAVTAYNLAIEGAKEYLNTNGLANCGVMDANTLLAAQPDMAKLHLMFLVPVMGLEAAASTTLFGLDGVHPNNHGYGIVANGFIEKINELAGTSVPLVDPAALIWDPTHGQAPDPGLNMNTGLGRIDPAVAESMGAIFRQ